MQPRSLCCLSAFGRFFGAEQSFTNRELLFAIHSAQYSLHSGRSCMSSYCRFENSLHQLSFLVLSLPNRRRCLRISHTHSTHTVSCAQLQRERQPSSFRIVNDVCKWLYVTYAFTMYYTFCNISWQCRHSLSWLLEKHPEKSIHFDSRCYSLPPFMFILLLFERNRCGFFTDGM